MATTPNDKQMVLRMKSEPEAAKPTSVPTVLVGVRALLLELALVVLEETFVEPHGRARILTLMAIVRQDGAPNKWRTAIEIDARLADGSTALDPRSPDDGS